MRIDKILEIQFINQRNNYLKKINYIFIKEPAYCKEIICYF